MIDLLKPLIDWDVLPRHHAAPGDMIVAGDESTSVLFCLEHGTASGTAEYNHVAGDIISLCEALALDNYATRIEAITDCQLIMIRRATLETALRTGGKLVLPLSRSIAADVTQRRLAG